MIGLKKILSLTMAVMICCTGLSSCKDKDASSSSNSNSDSKNISNMTSMEIVKDMGLGWNLGNTLDVCNADRDGDGNVDENSKKVDETLWGNPMTTKEMFQKIKDEGFNAVRIPITWRDHLNEDNTIDADWMNRVQEVVDYAYDLDMYVIINIHHDGGGDPNFGAWIRNASKDYDGVLVKFKKIWSQICERFKDYDERLVFESMNEVGFDDMGQSAAFETLNNLNQEFVNLVRASGGKNDNRHLLIAGYWTDVEKTCSPLFKMPTDPAGRSIISVHYYTPWEFCTTNINYQWGTEAEVNLMKSKVNDMVTNFVDKGIPVIMGEYGTGVWNELESGVYFSEMFTKLCTEAGIATFMWDNGELLNRKTLEWYYPDLITAVKRASSGKDYEVVKTNG